MDWFRLEGVSFTILSGVERDSVIREWEALLSSSREGVVLARRRSEAYTYKGYSFPVSYVDFYLGVRSRGEGGPPPYFSATKAEAPPRPRVRRLANPYTLELEGGSFARVLVAHRYPSMLPEGFLYSVFPLVAEVALVFRRVPRSKALSLVESARRRKALAESVEATYESESLRELAERVLAGSDLLEFYLLVTATAPSLRDLSDKEREVRALLKGFGLEVEAPPIQRDLYYFRTCSFLACLERAYSDVSSMGSLFFLVDEELIDDNGVFLGVSGTGSPVVLNPWTKPNLNFVILGVTGSGKSMTAKVFLKRLRELSRGIPYVGVDPESEYTRVSRLLGATPVEISEGQPLGLDPVKLLQLGYLEVGQVADVLSELYAVPERLQGLLRKELFTKGDAVADVEELVSSIRDAELRRYLEGVTAPPDAYVYRGEPPTIAGSTIFGLKNVRSKRLKILISALIATYAYNRLLTRSQKSVFFVDEAWLFMETPSIVSLFENIARRGRKYGVLFMYISQRAEDLAKTSQGRAILEQSATALILRQEPEGRDAVKQIYKLSDAEADFLVNATTGTGILKAGRKRLTLNVLPTEEELEAFSTTVR